MHAHAHTCTRDMQVAAPALHSGQLVAVPTDTLYGLACVAQSSAAVRQLYAIKGRDLVRATTSTLPPSPTLSSSFVDQLERTLAVVLPPPNTELAGVLPPPNPEGTQSTPAVSHSTFTQLYADMSYVDDVTTFFRENQSLYVFLPWMKYQSGQSARTSPQLVQTLARNVFLLTRTLMRCTDSLKRRGSTHPISVLSSR